jgi:glycine oxidase
MSTVGIVGGGIIGLSIAWRCAQLGLDVTVYDPAPGGGAGLVAAGMLAPTGEAGFGEDALRTLMLDAAARWPAFAVELRDATGVDVAYRGEGTLLVALTDDDLAEIRRLFEFYRRAGQRIEPMTARELREREPMLSPRVRGGAYAPGDRQVDPRKVLRALRQAAVRFVTATVTDLAAVHEEKTVVAAGCGSAALTGLPVRPVKGQLVRLRADEAPIRHVIRGYAQGRRVYVVPRLDGELVIGATEEERGADTTVTAGGVLDLLRPAADLLPGIAEFALTETLAGLRPGTPDNAPMIGVLRSGEIVATGHHRNGVLLAPVTADAVAELVSTGRQPTNLAAFQPERFA